MKRLPQVAIAWLALLAVSHCQATQEPTPLEAKPLKTSVEQITYLEADTGAFTKFIGDAVTGDNGKTIIFGDTLPTVRRYAVKLTVENQTNDWIEVHDKAKPFPPVILTAFKPGKYLINGTPGQTFFVSIRSNAPPVWLEVTIQPTGPPPVDPVDPPPAGDFAALKALVIEQAKKTGDQQTTLSLSSAFAGAAFNMTATGVDLDMAREMVREARADVMARRKGNIDWNPFLVAVEAEMIKLAITTKEQYHAAITAIHESLAEAAHAMTKNTSLDNSIPTAFPYYEIPVGTCPIPIRMRR